MTSDQTAIAIEPRGSAGPATSTTGAGATSAGAGATSAFEFEPHNCFACGSLNDHGMHLELHLGERRAWTELTLPDRFEGWHGIAHGGILATILDEVMAWSLIAEENWGVTARMTVGFRQPVRIGVPLRAEGWIVRSRRRLADTAGEIRAADGDVLATAEGVYVAASEARKKQLQERYGYRTRTMLATDGATPEPVDGR